MGMTVPQTLSWVERARTLEEIENGLRLVRDETAKIAGGCDLIIVVLPRKDKSLYCQRSLRSSSCKVTNPFVCAF